MGWVGVNKGQVYGCFQGVVGYCVVDWFGIYWDVSGEGFYFVVIVCDFDFKVEICYVWYLWEGNCMGYIRVFIIDGDVCVGNRVDVILVDCNIWLCSLYERVW